jgi:hypothetical protein
VSEPGEGAEFVVTLPIKGAKSPNPAVRAESTPPAQVETSV